jgi:septum formation protein
MLRGLGISAEVRPATVPEIPLPHEPAESFARRTAEEKARRVAVEVLSGLVIGADTVVAVDTEILGKPADQKDACSMLRKLSGKRHSVVSGVALVLKPGGEVVSGIDTTEVEFDRLSDEEIAWYAGTKEPYDKAGGYALQGLAALFITRVMGSPSNVIGLPLSLLYTLCMQIGIDLKQIAGQLDPPSPPALEI